MPSIFQIYKHRNELKNACETFNQFSEIIYTFNSTTSRTAVQKMMQWCFSASIQKAKSLELDVEKLNTANSQFCMQYR